MSGTGSDSGWLEAAIAWEVCASLHRQYCKGKDALFTTRQSDFVKHAENARGRTHPAQEVQLNPDMPITTRKSSNRKINMTENTTASGADDPYPSLYESTGNIEDINTLLVPRASLAEFALRALLPGGTMRYTAPPAPTEQWVSVGERLPEWVHRDDTPCFINGKEVPPTLTSKTVLVALDGGGVRTDKLTTIEGKSNGWWNTFGERVIAWQDAPAPPQGAAKGE